MFAFKKIPISEYQKITPDPFTIYKVVKEPGVYDADTGYLRANWEELITPIPNERGAIFEVDENGCLTIGSDVQAQFVWSNLDENGILIFAEGIKKIQSPFDYSHLKGVILADSINEVSPGFMEHASNLTTFIAGNNLKKLPSQICYMAPVKNIMLGDNIEIIDVAAFEYCDISSIELPSSLKRVADEAFSMCPNLKSVTIPASMTSINAGAFPRNPIYHDGKLVSEGLEEYIFENRSGWYLCEDPGGTTIIEPLNISSNGRINAKELPNYPLYYFVRK